jgi:hypothetical protein
VDCRDLQVRARLIPYAMLRRAAPNYSASPVHLREHAIADHFSFGVVGRLPAFGIAGVIPAITTGYVRDKVHAPRCPFPFYEYARRARAEEPKRRIAKNP